MRHKVLTILAVASLCFSSCDDFLTEDVRGRQNLDTYFQSANDAQSFVTGCYQAITFGGWWNINTVWLMSEMCSDDGWMGNTTQSQSDYISLAHYQGSGQSNGAISNFWQYRYKGILRCNIAIDRIGKSNLADEQLKQRLIGEARFLSTSSWCATSAECPWWTPSRCPRRLPASPVRRWRTATSSSRRT